LGTLYVVATPIGNLEDLSPRARRILSEVALIAAEDTRHTGAMLHRLGIRTPLLSNHGFNERSRVTRFLDALRRGDVALVSDSGTPAISDPGAILVRAAADAGFSVVPIPGPSAAVAAVSASGLIEGPFLFVGFLPRGSTERKETLASYLRLGVPLVLYESAPRVVGMSELLAELAPDRSVVVFREITKLHEEAIRASTALLPELLRSATLKGEFVVVVGKGMPQDLLDPRDEILLRLKRGDRPSEIARDVAREIGRPRSEVYELVQTLRTAKP
jgi:16S rRNA (cytidine1402-2'-O)-methyltransferase